MKFLIIAILLFSKAAFSSPAVQSATQFSVLLTSAGVAQQISTTKMLCDSYVVMGGSASAATFYIGVTSAAAAASIGFPVQAQTTYNDSAADGKRIDLSDRYFTGTATGANEFIVVQCNY